MGTLSISVTSELMKNYKQSELMSPEEKFEALQTNTGCSLLFSIGTDKVLYVTEELEGHSTGWEKTDLSTAQITNSFQGKSGVSCKTFDVAQSIVDGTIGMAMVVDDNGTDTLFLSLGNSNSDTSWVKKPQWVQYPFDNPSKNVTIVNVFISETKNNTQFIVVDILRDPASTEKLISRYYINTNHGSNPAWEPHDVSIDLEADSYTSCLGRQYLPKSPHQPTIDGLYTAGKVGGNAQLFFQPLYNVYDTNVPPGPAQPARLNLPGGLVADTITACRKPDMSSDLYACSQGGLYYFASSNQSDGATAVLLGTNTIFNGVRKMVAHQMNGTVMVWGLNGNDEVFYTACAVGQETATPSQWTYPVPILTGVDLFSPYINKIDTSNTFFAVSGETLQKLIKSPTDSIWQSQSITLPSLDTKDTNKYSSYTTRIEVLDESKQPVPNRPLTITAPSRTPVYINHLYYIIDPIGVQVNTDTLGSITVIEWVESLSGTKLTVSDAAAGLSIEHDPTDKPFTKLAQLNTVDSLKNAVITTDDGKNPVSTKPLVSSNVSQTDLEAVAASNTQLGTAYQNLLKKQAVPRAALAAGVQPHTNLGSFADAIIVDAGNLFNWLKSGVKAVIHVFEDAAKGIWHFVAEIAGKVFACVLDVVEKIVEAAVWVFNTIKTAIEDVIKFLEYLFGWEDILITHRVMKNVFLQFAQHQVDNLSNLKGDISAAIKSVEANLDKWANIPGFDQTPGGVSSSNAAPAGINSSPAHLGAHHFQGNASNVSSDFSPVGITEEIFDDLLQLVKNEGDTLNGAYNAIKDDIVAKFNQLSLYEIIKKFTTVIVDTLLQTVENVLLTAIDVFTQLVTGAIQLLNTPLQIPVLSWLYNEITGDELSVLDLVCLIGAIPATIVYKLAAAAAGKSGAAPFPKGDSFTNSLLGATSFAAIKNAFYTGPAANLAPRLAAAPNPTPVLDDSKLKVFGFVSGLFAAFGSVVLIVTSGIQRIMDLGEDSKIVSFGGKVKKTIALIAAIGNVAYVSPNIATWINVKTDNWYQQLNNGLTAVSIIKGFVNIPISVASPGIGKASALVETAINIAWNVPVIYNIIDNKDRFNTDYKSLIPESIGNFAFNIGGMMEFPIALIPNQSVEAKAITSLVQYGFMLVYGICMPIAGGIYEFVPGQNHS